jgi:hypothetical protein
VHENGELGVGNELADMAMLLQTSTSGRGRRPDWSRETAKDADIDEEELGHRGQR